MKKTITLFAAATTLLVSCGSTDSPKNEFEEAQMKSEHLENGAVNDPIEFNDGLVAHIDMSEVHLAQLYDLDDQDVSGDEMEAAAKKIIDDLADRISGLEKVEAVGNIGDAFLEATIDQLKSTKALAKAYFDFSEDLAVPDEEWTDDMVESWEMATDPLYEQYDNTFDELENTQAAYAAKQDFQVVDTGVTIDDMYEQSKED
jgi:hypothetical protein